MVGRYICERRQYRNAERKTQPSRGRAGAIRGQSNDLSSNRSRNQSGRGGVYPGLGLANHRRLDRDDLDGRGPKTPPLSTSYFGRLGGPADRLLARDVVSAAC